MEKRIKRVVKALAKAENNADVEMFYVEMDKTKNVLRYCTFYKVEAEHIVGEYPLYFTKDIPFTSWESYEVLDWETMTVKPFWDSTTPIADIRRWFAKAVSMSELLDALDMKLHHDPRTYSGMRETIAAIREASRFAVMPPAWEPRA